MIKKERCGSYLENRRVASVGWFSIVSARFSSKSHVQKNRLARIGLATAEKKPLHLYSHILMFSHPPNVAVQKNTNIMFQGPYFAAYQTRQLAIKFPATYHNDV